MACTPCTKIVFPENLSVSIQSVFENFQERSVKWASAKVCCNADHAANCDHNIFLNQKIFLRYWTFSVNKGEICPFIRRKHTFLFYGPDFCVLSRTTECAVIKRLDHEWRCRWSCALHQLQGMADIGQLKRQRCLGRHYFSYGFATMKLKLAPITPRNVFHQAVKCTVIFHLIASIAEFSTLEQ